MGTYKSNTRTVLNTTLTSASSYSSGALAVGDLYELAIDYNVTAVTYTSGSLYMTISRIGADGASYAIDDITLNATGKYSVDLGVGSTLTHPFGDQIQLDLIASGGNNVTTTISILGK